MRKRIASLIKIVGLFGLLAAFAYPAVAQVSQLFPDACQTGFSQMKGVPIAAATSGTVQLVAPVVGQTISICGLWINSVGGTSLFEYGTGAACTGTHALTGAMAAATTLSIFPGRTIMGVVPVDATSGNGLCLVSGTSTTATEGWMLYVQQ